MKEGRVLSTAQLAAFTKHQLILNLAQCAIVAAEAQLEIRKAQQKQALAMFGVFRLRLAAEFNLKPDDDIDEITGVITGAVK